MRLLLSVLLESPPKASVTSIGFLFLWIFSVKGCAMFPMNGYQMITTWMVYSKHAFFSSPYLALQVNDIFMQLNSLKKTRLRCGGPVILSQRHAGRRLLTYKWLVCSTCWTCCFSIQLSSFSFSWLWSRSGTDCDITDVRSNVSFRPLQEPYCRVISGQRRRSTVRLIPYKDTGFPEPFYSHLSQFA